MLLLMLVATVTAFAQVRNVKGKVLDKNKQPFRSTRSPKKL